MRLVVSKQSVRGAVFSGGRGSACGDTHSSCSILMGSSESMRAVPCPCFLASQALPCQPSHNIPWHAVAMETDERDAAASKDKDDKDAKQADAGSAVGATAPAEDGADKKAPPAPEPGSFTLENPCRVMSFLLAKHRVALPARNTTPRCGAPES